MTDRCRYRYVVLLGLCANWAAINPAGAAEEGLNLTAAYDASRLNDPTVQSAAHAFDASSHEEAIGRGGLYPQVSLSSRYGYGGRIDGGDDNTYVNSNDYQANSVTLAAQQPLYDKGRWAAYEEGKARGSWVPNYSMLPARPCSTGWPKAISTSPVQRTRSS